MFSLANIDDSMAGSPWFYLRSAVLTEDSACSKPTRLSLSGCRLWPVASWDTVLVYNCGLFLFAFSFFSFQDDTRNTPRHILHDDTPEERDNTATHPSQHTYGSHRPDCYKAINILFSFDERQFHSRFQYFFCYSADWVFRGMHLLVFGFGMDTSTG